MLWCWLKSSEPVQNEGNVAKEFNTGFFLLAKNTCIGRGEYNLYANGFLCALRGSSKSLILIDCIVCGGYVRITSADKLQILLIQGLGWTST